MLATKRKLGGRACVARGNCTATKRNSLRTTAAENEQSEITGFSSAFVQMGRMHGSLPAPIVRGCGTSAQGGRLEGKLGKSKTKV